VLKTDLKSLCLKDILFKKTKFVIANEIGNAIEKVVSSRINSSRTKNTEHNRNMSATALPFESLKRLLKMVRNRTLYDKKSRTNNAIKT
jgi:hypothetical protein